MQEICGNIVNEYTCFMNYLTLCMNYDYPEAFWTGNAANWGTGWGYGYSYNPSAGTGTVEYNMNLTFTLKGDYFDYRIAEFRDPTTLSSTVTEFKTKVNSITESYKSKTRYEQVSGLNDWLTKHNSYNSDLLQTGTAAEIAWSPMSALRASTGALGPVCEGYACAFKCLCDKLSIPCILATGNAKNSKSGAGEAHMWNEVQMDNNEWYAVDVTWNDPIIAGADNNKKVSGGENEFWLLLGQNDEVAPGFTFAESHLNNPAGDNAYQNQWELLFASLITDTHYEPEETLKDGDWLMAKTIEGIDMNFQVISAKDKTCMVAAKSLNMEFHAIDVNAEGTVTIPAEVNGLKVVAIDDMAFYNCSFESITIPKSVTSIGGEIFFWCYGLTSIEVEAGNPVYDSRDNCNAIIETATNKLVAVCPVSTIPEDIKVIGSYACASNNSISANLPEGIEVIEDRALHRCSLGSIIFPSTVKSMGAELFVDEYHPCESLTSVTVQSAEPAIICDKTFAGCPNLTTLNVPAGSKAAYTAAEGWKEFKNIVEMGAITIGKSGKASYCGDKSLDFSYSEEVKAYIATGFDKDEGTIWLTRVKDVPAGVPVLIKGEAEKTYQVPVTDSQNSYYTNMFVGNTTGASIEIYETSDDGSKVNYYLKDGTFLSVTGNAKIGKNKCYLQLPATFNASVTGASQSVTVGQTGKASFAAPVDLDFTNVEGLKAFTATGYDKSTKTIWLTRVLKVQQGEGVLLKGDPDNYEIPSVAAQSHYENMFVGNTSGASIEIYETSDDGSQTNYYLKGGTFLSVTGNAIIGNNKCYLPLPTSMVAGAASTRGSEKSYKFEEPEMIKLPISFRSLENDGDGTTGIKVQSSMFNQMLTTLFKVSAS